MKIIVSRHPGAIEWIRQQRPDLADVAAVAELTRAAAKGATIYGNVPLSHASVARCVWAIEFSGAPPRGAEYTADEMTAAGARLQCYTVADVSSRSQCGAYVGIEECSILDAAPSLYVWPPTMTARQRAGTSK